MAHKRLLLIAVAALAIRPAASHSECMCHGGRTMGDCSQAQVAACNASAPQAADHEHDDSSLGKGHHQGDEKELLTLKPEQIDRLEKRWRGSYQSAHKRIHELLDQLADEPKAPEELAKQQQDVKDGVNKILRLGLSFIRVEHEPLPPEARATAFKKIDDAMDKAEDKLEHVKIMDNGKDTNVHEIFMTETALSSIMSDVDRAAKNQGGGHWDRTIEKDPSAPSLWVGAGKDYLRNGEGEKAAEYFGKAIKLDPNNGDAWTGRALANYSLKDYPSAADDAKAALRINPDNKAALETRALSEGRGAGGYSSDPVSGQAASGQNAAGAGSSSSSGGAFASAKPPASSAASAAVIQSNDLAREAQRALGMRDYEAAAALAAKAIALNSQNGEAYFLRSVAESRLHRYDEALSDAVAGLKLDPKNGPLLDGKAAALNGLKRYKEALEAANIALEANPNDAAAYRARAEALAGLGDREGMIDSLRKAAAIDPQYQPTLDRALQLPTNADLAFLFSAGDAAAAPKAGPNAGAVSRRFGVIVASSILGGLLIAIGLVQLLMPSLKSGITRVASRARAPVVGASPFLRDGEGRLLKGTYQILRQIGAGGMGMVFEGRDISLGRPVAIKRMREELKLDRRLRERFTTEAKLVAALRHPHIVDIYAIVEEGEEVYLVFEFVTGKTVHELVYGKGPLSLPEALPIVRGAASALDYAHGRGVIHRDLKPSNVMVSEEGFAKVMDFGIARLAKDALSRYSMTNTVVGTPPYMAPEQEQGVVRKESDVYSLAVCLYEMLTGQLPFAGSGAGMLMAKVENKYAPASRLAEGLPQGIDEFFSRALDPDPDKRFRGAKEFISAFEALRAARV